ncbi:MAG: DNA-binding protein WhiA [Nitriliruptoraceae bacterium]
MPGTFTTAVRQELAQLPLGSGVEVRAELLGLVRTIATLAVRGGPDPTPVVVFETAEGAVARRVHALLLRRYRLRPELRVRSGEGVRHQARYAVAVTASAGRLVRDLGVVDDHGRLEPHLGTGLLPSERPALLRGAVLGAGSFSAPGRPAHLEIRVRHRVTATDLAAVLAEVVGPGPSVPTSGPTRVVLKSGRRIGALLAAVGATSAYLALEEQQVRREVRAEATRLANADRANLARTVTASAAQAEAVTRAIERHGWDGLEPELREVALTRLANPEASLAELGALLDPPVGKSAVHRRLRRLEELGDRGATDEGEPVDP